MGTYIVGGVFILLVILASRKIIKDKITGKKSCSFGCSSCSKAGCCSKAACYIEEKEAGNIGR